jgi:hypothetical protein
MRVRFPSPAPPSAAGPGVIWVTFGASGERRVRSCHLRAILPSHGFMRRPTGGLRCSQVATEPDAGGDFACLVLDALPRRTGQMERRPRPVCRADPARRWASPPPKSTATTTTAPTCLSRHWSAAHLATPLPTSETRAGYRRGFEAGQARVPGARARQRKTRLREGDRVVYKDIVAPRPHRVEAVTNLPGTPSRPQGWVADWLAGQPRTVAATSGYRRHQMAGRAGHPRGSSARG